MGTSKISQLAECHFEQKLKSYWTILAQSTHISFVWTNKTRNSYVFYIAYFL